MSDRRNYTAPLRWGIIGCGDVTEVKSGPPFKNTEGFELAAVMRRDLDKLKDYARRHEIDTYYTDADALIHSAEIDAVYIATPPDTHKFYGLKVAKAGKPCCIEKPLAPCYADSIAIFNAFENKGIPLFVAYYRRSLPRFTQVNDWLQSEAIGKVRHINWQLSTAPSETDTSGRYNWRTDPKVAPGGYFDDLASHGIDLFTFILGDIIEAYGISLNQQDLYQAKDAITACWLHKGEVTGSGNWNFGCDRNEDRVEILGSKGKIQFSIFQDNPLILDSIDRQLEVLIEHPKHVQQFHIENMKRHLLEENYAHPSTGRSAAHTSWVMDKILGTIG